MTLTFSPAAEKDFESILYAIARDKPQAAVRFVEDLESRCKSLLQFPYVGTVRDDLVPGLRCLSHRRYTICFRIAEESIRIERVLRPGMNLGAEQF